MSDTMDTLLTDEVHASNESCTRHHVHNNTPYDGLRASLPTPSDPTMFESAHIRDVHTTWQTIKMLSVYLSHWWTRYYNYNHNGGTFINITILSAVSMNINLLYCHHQHIVSLAFSVQTRANAPHESELSRNAPFLDQIYIQYTTCRWYPTSIDLSSIR
jgi:hypothetical protein